MTNNNDELKKINDQLISIVEGLNVDNRDLSLFVAFMNWDDLSLQKQIDLLTEVRKELGSDETELRDMIDRFVEVYNENQNSL